MEAAGGGRGGDGLTRSRRSLLDRFKWSLELALRAPRQGRFPFRSPETIRRAQERRLRRTVVHAWQHVPYYREAMRRLDLRPGDFRTAADLSRLPIIERQDLQRDPEYFVSRAEPIDSYLQLRSGATSGRPVTVFYDPRALFEEAAHGERRRNVIMKLAGKRLRYTAARILIPDSGSGRAATAFRGRSLVPTSIRIAERYLSIFDDPARNAKLINGFRPDVVATFGSYLGTLFRHVQENGCDFHVPKVVTYGADPLPDSARRLITERFGSAVLSIYGSIEAPAIGFECEQHRGHHLNVDLYPLRIVGADDAEVPPGESGDVLISNLVNRGTVLLNYRQGDIASLIPGRCPCGRSLPMLSFVEGRVDDWLQLPARERVHPQAVLEPLEQEEGIWQFQVVQEEIDRFRVAVVAARGCDREGLRSRLVPNLVAMLGEGVTIDLSFVDALPTSRGGKTRAVVSLPGRERSHFGARGA